MAPSALGPGRTRPRSKIALLPLSPVAAARVHGFLACALVVQTALQFLLKAWSEVLEIVLFVSVTGGFLLATWVLKGPRGLVGLVTDTWIQRFAALFLGALAVSFLWGDQSGRGLLALLRLPTYLLVIGIVLESMRGGPGRMSSVAWTTLGAISLVYGLAFVEFFWGSDVLGLKCTEPTCLPHDWRWEGLLSDEADRPIGIFARYGKILIASVIGRAYGFARLGLFGIAAYALGMGLVLNSAGMRPKLIAGGLASFCLFGVLLGGSRSVTLVAAGLTVAFTALTALCTRNLRLVRTCVVTNLVVFAVLFGCWRALPAGITAVDRLVTPTQEYVRFSPEVFERFPAWSTGLPGNLARVDYSGRFDPGAGRRDAWQVGWDLFLENPWGGAGFRMFQPEYARRRPERVLAAAAPSGVVPVGVHSGYLKVLAETGLLGGVLFLALIGRALTVMTPARAPGSSSAENVWRVAFLSAFVGMLAVNAVDTHSEDRLFWIVLGFAAAVETWNTGPPGGRIEVTS